MNKQINLNNKPESKTSRGKLIVIDASNDRLGKTTIVDGIVRTLQDANIKIKTYHFPNNNQPLGNAIYKLLNPALPITIPELDPLFVSHLYLADMTYTQRQIKRDLEDGFYVLLDRYYTSTMIYETTIARLNGDYDMSFYKRVEDIALTTYKLLKPDFTFFLHADDIISTFYNGVADVEDALENPTMQRELITTFNYIKNETDAFKDAYFYNRGDDENLLEKEYIIADIISKLGFTC